MNVRLLILLFCVLSGACLPARARADDGTSAPATEQARSDDTVKSENADEKRDSHEAALAPATRIIVPKEGGAERPRPSWSGPHGFVPEEEPWTLSDDQLRAAGWEFRRQHFRRGSALAGLAALTVGIPFHGIGHLLVGDNEAMFRLLISEVLALGVAGIGTLARTAASHRNGVWAAGSALQVIGLSAFTAGWLTDVVGSFKGTTVPLPRNSADLPGMALDLYYTILFSDEVDISSVGVVGFQWQNAHFFVRPQFSFGPADKYYRGDLLAEYRHPMKWGEHSYLTVWAELGEEVFGEENWGREIALGGLGITMDMGDFIEHTHGLVWKLRVGLGMQSFHYGSQNHRRFLRRNVRLLLPVETSIGINLNRILNLEVGYRHRPDELVGTLSRFGGMLYQQFTVLPLHRLSIAIRVEEGAYSRLWVGLRYFLQTPEL